MSEFDFEIDIPADNDGFVPMQCPCCGESFMLRPEDIEDDSVLCIRCPMCGIVSNGYFTPDIIDLALAKAGNCALDAIHGEMKKLECKSKNAAVEFKAGKAPRHEQESRIVQSLSALLKVECEYCGRSAKVAAALRMSAYICPCCGVSNFNDR